MKLQLCYPLNLPFNVNQKFGENLNPLYKEYGMLGHNGYDFSASDGTPVYASHAGEITYAGLDGANGLLVVVKTNEQYDYKDGQSYFKTLYGHLKTNSIIVTPGQKVRKGEKLAEADNTGASTGSHLHWGLKPILPGEEDWKWFNYEQDNGYNGAIDPTPYMDFTYPKDWQPHFATDLKLYDAGDEVAKMQRFLVEHGYMANPKFYGYYGQITRHALYLYQVDHVTLSWYEKNILKGSRFGPKTREAFNN